MLYAQILSVWVRTELLHVEIRRMDTKNALST